MSSPASFESTPAKSSMPDWYPELLASVTGKVNAGRSKAIAAANQEMLVSYLAVGRDILDRQSLEGWGARIIERLSADLKRQFPEATGFSPRNLKYMRAFAETWPAEAIVQAPLAQLPWYHHLALIQKLNDPEARLWYMSAAIDDGWSRNVLAHQIETKLHERSGKAITNFKSILPPSALTLPSSRSRTRMSLTSCP